METPLKPCAGCNQNKKIWKRFQGKGYCSSCWNSHPANTTQKLSRSTGFSPRSSPMGSGDAGLKNSTGFLRKVPLSTGTSSLKRNSTLSSSASGKVGNGLNSSKKLRSVSTKQADLNQQYSRSRQEFLSKPENQECRAQGLLPTSVGCKGSDTSYLEIHHSKGRGIYLLDTSTWVVLCHFCHAHLETHPNLSRELGFTISRLT